MNLLKTIVLPAIILIISANDLFSQPNEKKIPTEFHNNRIYVTPVTKEGDTLRLYSDTGGGINMMYEKTITDLNLDTKFKIMGGDSVRVYKLDNLKDDFKIPLNADSSPLGEYFWVTTPRGPKQMTENSSGFLSSKWFANRIWKFNYPKEELWLLEDSPKSSKHTIPVGFQSNKSGKRTTHFPRITVEVGGDSLDMLFDTGATSFLNDKAGKIVGAQKPYTVGASYIEADIFNKWKENNPDWRVITGQDLHLNVPIIEVPKIKIANHEVGPVWFTKRPNKTFSIRMSEWMDKPIQGALGGSAFQYFEIILDYPNAKATFILE